MKQRKEEITLYTKENLCLTGGFRFGNIELAKITHLGLARGTVGFNLPTYARNKQKNRIKSNARTRN
ncbi:MAG: hypothetical protein HYZ51_05095 [Candidatus Doudnabacteria bacterium]|nr:hypothetical protein [Candidatus Doudnabacteria bacterium]